PYESNREGQPVLLRPRRTVDEYTTGLAASPGVLQYFARQCGGGPSCRRDRRPRKIQPGSRCLCPSVLPSGVEAFLSAKARPSVRLIRTVNGTVTNPGGGVGPVSNRTSTPGKEGQVAKEVGQRSAGPPVGHRPHRLLTADRPPNSTALSSMCPR